MTEDKYYVDPNWCFENPDEAAAEMARLHKWCDELEADRDSAVSDLRKFHSVLPKLKYKWQAEALDSAVDLHICDSEDQRAVLNMAAELRRQAEEEV